jgi:hypothetical protein
MHARDLRKMIAPLLAALLAGCASNPAPKGWRPSAAEAQRATRGGWILIEREEDTNVTGELIAVDPATLHVLTVSGLQSVPRSAVRKARLVGYGTTEHLWIWTGVGALSTLSHGGWIVVTLPVWLIGGSVAASGEAKAAYVPPENFARFARFPQGLPPSFDPSSLGPLAEEAVPPDAESPR